jgi:hypothetical protein
MTKRDPDWEKLKDHFIANLVNGIVLSTPELEKYCKKRKWSVETKKIARIRRYWKFTAIFEPIRQKPRYMSASILKFGTVMMDIGFLRQYKSRNNKYEAFLCGKELVSGAIRAVEIRTKSIRDVYDGVKKLLSLGNFKQAHTIVFDREAAVRSPKFQSLLYSQLGVRVFFLKNRSKSYYSEIAINYIKKRIAMKVEASGNTRWIGNTLQNIVDHYNDKLIPNTTFTPNSITRANSQTFLAQKFGVKNPSLLFNASSLKDINIRNKKWLRRIFKFAPGDKVLLAKKVNFTDKPLKKKLSSTKDLPFTQMTPSYVGSKRFQKASLTGSYSKTVYTIDKRYLKSNNKFYWAVVYTLLEIPNSHWYQS